VGTLDAQVLRLDHQLEGPRLTQNPRQALGSAGTGEHSQRDLGQAELERRTSGGKAQVSGQCDLQTAADAVAVDRGDDQLWGLLQAQQGLVGVQAEVVLEGGGDALQHRDVGAGAEELFAGAGKDDDVHVVIHAGAQDRRVERLHHLVGVGVGGRVVQGQDGDATVGVVAA